jgi:phosphoesterase RecJ-like protein
LLTEVEQSGDEPPRVKISMRSKECDEPVNVNLVAQQFNGGGHARAAGARAEGTLDDVRAQLVQALSR